MLRRCQPAKGEWKRQKVRERGGETERQWTIWTPLARFPRPLQSLELTSHIIRCSVNQQLGAQMKKCQLLPGAQQADRPCTRAPQHGLTPTHPSTHTACSTCTHTHTYNPHSSPRQVQLCISRPVLAEGSTEQHGSIRHVAIVYTKGWQLFPVDLSHSSPAASTDLRRPTRMKQRAKRERGGKDRWQVQTSAFSSGFCP